MVTSLTIPLSGSVSSAYAIATGGGKALAIGIGSYAALGWALDASPDNGATWPPLLRPDGTGLPFVVASGGGGFLAIVDPVPGLLRVRCSSAVTAAVPLVLTPLRR